MGTHNFNRNRFDEGKAKSFVDYAITAVMALVVMALCVGVVSCQFTVYRKKHGPQMTFWDFLIDSERK